MKVCGGVRTPLAPFISKVALDGVSGRPHFPFSVLPAKSPLYPLSKTAPRSAPEPVWIP